MNRLSVIVPVYNVRKYLVACLESVLAQGVQGLEMILVDDGSTDGCGAICDAYAAKYPFIKLVRQPNRGLSAARNVGLSSASGEYVWFLDSDDLIAPDTLEEMLQLAETSVADVLLGYYAVVQDAPLVVVLAQDCKLDKSRIDGCPPAQVLEQLGQDNFSVTACRYMLRRDFLLEHRLFFKSGILHEDHLWTPQMLCWAQRFVLYPKTFYLYRQRAASIMATQNPKRVTDLLDTAVALDDLGQQLPAKRGYLARAACQSIVGAMRMVPALPAAEKQDVKQWFREHRPVVRQGAATKPALKWLCGLLGGYRGLWLYATALNFVIARLNRHREKKARQKPRGERV